MSGLRISRRSRGVVWWRRAEIMNIMTALFDQDYVTRMYGVDQKREGKIEEKKETALKMLKKGFDIDVISEMTELPAKEIMELKNQESNN